MRWGMEKGEAQVSTQQAHAPSQDPSSRGPVMRRRRFCMAASVQGVGVGPIRCWQVPRAAPCATAVPSWTFGVGGAQSSGGC